MTKDEYWAAVVKKYPNLVDDEYLVTLTSRGLKKLVEQAHEFGHTLGVKNGRAIEANEQDKKKKTKENTNLGGFNDIFGGIFK